MPKKPKAPQPIATHKHKDKRLNIPTQELRDFVAAEEAQPKQVAYPGLLYARDPSLDPQLVWKGKDEQDREELVVDNVPIYIQEKIHAQVIIEEVRAWAKQEKPEQQINLFADFNGITDFEKKVDFYHHEQNWSNRMILGDSLLVMTSLAEKEGLKGKVQCLYFDPPYGINFGSNWQVSTRKREVADGKAADVTRQPEQIRAFRDTWKLGIHSYLAYLRDRLTAARELLTESGSVFVQIGDENVHLVRAVLDEVFGSENFCAMITFAKTTGATSEIIPATCDYLLWYAKVRSRVKNRQLFQAKVIGGVGGTNYTRVELPDGTRRGMTEEELRNPDLIPEGGKIYRLDHLVSSHSWEEGRKPFVFEGKTYSPGQNCWKTTIDGLQKLAERRRLIGVGNTLCYVRYYNDFPVWPLANLWTDTNISGFGDRKTYVVQTFARIVERCLLMTTDPGDLVLDPTCGSGTTAYVAEQWGRRWITIDTSRVAIALARTRLMAARFPYYLLADSPEGERKEMDLTGQVTNSPLTAHHSHDVRKGFIYKRVPHVTLKSIANNPDIKEGMSREQIDAAIARHADTELLYDKPYEDNKRIRVTGPFTVESLSPHRVLATDEERPATEAAAQKAPGPGQFETMIIDNLKKAGVQNARKNERLKFDRLDTFAGAWLHAAGEFTDKDGASRRVAVSIGPEHGTVGPEQVKEAAKETLRGVGFDLLIVLGFAFDAHAGEAAAQFAPDIPKRVEAFAVAEEYRQLGKLPVVLARMNPDLAMGDELLKKTGAGNLFMVFGEPDVDIKRDNDSKIVVEIKGLDVYDPTTGQIRSSSTDDIACWFIDTNYNSESFFVRHAYFTGADEPYDKLKRALRAEIDESAWSALYSTKSRPFDPPATGKIAVKVINHYGDEVLKVYETRDD